MLESGSSTQSTHPATNNHNVVSVSIDQVVREPPAVTIPVARDDDAWYQYPAHRYGQQLIEEVTNNREDEERRQEIN